MFFKSGGDTSEMLDPAEKAFDAIVFPVKFLAKWVRLFAIALVRNIRRGALLLQAFSEPIGVVGLVAKKNHTFGQVDQQLRRANGVMALTGRQDKPDRQAPCVGQDVYLGAQSSSATPHTMNCVVFFTLAAC